MKTDKEKMLSGEPYIPYGDELVSERINASKLLTEYNKLGSEELVKRERILKILLGKTGEKMRIEPPFQCDYGYNISLGENFFANYYLTILDCARVSIGDNVYMGPNIGIYTAGHPLHNNLRNQDYEYAFPIEIGNNVWIGGHVVINPGISIGDNTVIGSGSVVTKNIPSNVVAMGNPCRVYREITEEDKNYYYGKRKFPYVK